MGQLFEMIPNLPKKEVKESVNQTIYLKFADMEKMGEAMKILNLEDLIKSDQKLFTPELFGSVQFVGINPKKPDRELKLTFSEFQGGRGQEILNYLHDKGVHLDTKENGMEEEPYSVGPEDLKNAA